MENHDRQPPEETQHIEYDYWAFDVYSFVVTIGKLIMRTSDKYPYVNASSFSSTNGFALNIIDDISDIRHIYYLLSVKYMYTVFET